MAVIHEEGFDPTADKRDLAVLPNTFLLKTHEGFDNDGKHQPTHADTASPSERHTPVSVQHLYLEVFSLLLAAASLIGLVILLKHYDDRPGPQWSLGDWGVTLNAILSIVSAVFRSSLLVPVAQTHSQSSWIWYMQPRPLRDLTFYDSASRGPLGSIRLLCRLHFRHFASVAAVIMITALALDPFFQQSIRYVSREVVDTSQKAQAVTAYTWGADIAENGEFSNAYVNIPYNMKAAMRNGLISSNPLSLPSPPFSCPTGNCTWDPFATLAVGTQCEDVKSYVRINCSDDEYSIGSESVCHFEAPGDAYLAKLTNQTSQYTVLLMQSSIPTQKDGSFSVLEPYINNTASLGLVEWVKTTKDSTIGPTSEFEAVRCDFYLSAREVLPTVVNGAYSEQLLQEVTHPEPVEGLSYTGDDPTEYFLSPFGSYDNVTYKFPSSAAPGDGGARREYTFRLNMKEFVALSSQITGGGTDSLHGKVVTGTAGGEPMGPSTLTMLWQADNVTRAMYNMAEAITTQMRANSTDLLRQERQDASLIAPDQAVDGQVWVQKQIVVVRWAWLVFPIVLLVLAALSLFAAYVETRRKRVGLWQSSPLTLFFHARPVYHGANEGIMPDAACLNNARAMGMAASQLTARISPHAHGTIEVYLRPTQG